MMIIRLPTDDFVNCRLSYHRDTIDVDIIVVVVIVVDIVVGVGYGVEKHDHESEEIETVETEISDTTWTRTSFHSAIFVVRIEGIGQI